MTITERTLRKWRKEALVVDSAIGPDKGLHDMIRAQAREMIDRILRMTQELLDQHLLRKK